MKMISLIGYFSKTWIIYEKINDNTYLVICFAGIEIKCVEFLLHSSVYSEARVFDT